MGLRRNLTVDEITDQILYFMQQGCSINSISFMGMGEPFANPQVFEALHDLTAPELFGLSQRRITISTIGIVPGIQKLTREYPQVNLAYSLHAPTDRLRETLMPITKTYPLGQVLDTLDQHIRQTNRKVFLAYIMLNFQFIGGMKVGEPSADGRGSAPPELAEQQARAGSEAAPATPPL